MRSLMGLHLLVLVHFLGLGGFAVADTGLRAAVCVVGQIARTELQSKIDNLIKVNLGSVEIDVFLILQPGKARFTIRGHKACQVAPASLEEAQATLSAHTRTFAFENKFVNWSVHEEKWVHFPERGESRKIRIVNNLSQYLSWQRCAKLIAQQEVTDGVGGSDNVRRGYDVVLRLRDNALVLRPFHLGERLTALVRDSYKKVGKEPPTTLSIQDVRELPVVVKACSSWEGFPDKTMLVPRKYMDDALRGPAELFHLMREGSSRTENGEIKVTNTETYLKYVFQKLQVPVVQE
eukprot:CAMPEP_0177784874 /NCGR_PEP_ID=MMETSP0491_2-20121128/19967_1 /TAXON_ID=63592 /ORGANISM="Tetraselmis chuii, Strain PLY429" /LENGTH=291 /DNA_ID=CAMNT_0019305737 /DNA_START=224 /DNA_END=1096 /DNA_ORIENTATION=+